MEYKVISVRDLQEEIPGLGPYRNEVISAALMTKAFNLVGKWAASKQLEIVQYIPPFDGVTPALFVFKPVTALI